MANEFGAFSDGQNLILRPANSTLGRVIVDGGLGFNSLPVKSHNAYTGSGKFEQTFAVSTADASPTTIATIAIPTDSAVAFRGSIVGKRISTADGYVGFITTMGVTNNGGTVAEIAAETITAIENSAGTPASASLVSGTNYIVQVTGIAAQTWHWVVHLEWTIVIVAA